MLVYKGSTDHVAETGKVIEATVDNLTTAIANQLEIIIKMIGENSNHTAAEFWAAQGSGGITLLQEFAYWQSILNTKSPAKVSSIITQAGTSLIVDQNTGIVSLP